MENTLLDRMEVRTIFRRNLTCKSVELSLLECISDALGQVIEENNRRLMEQFEVISKRGQ